ncbi:MAG: hypothetical protein Q4P15_02545 [Propionibacteriaceae bacterium]|nr:hypothetical protein [Propionibacteriaceae bacterium]
MIKILEMLNGWRATLNKAEVAAAGTCEYSDVKHQLDQLKAAVNAAKAADDADANSYWTDIKSKIVNILHYEAERTRFGNEVDALKAQATAQLNHVESRCEIRIGQHKDVPRKLEDDFQAWSDNRTSVVRNIEAIGKFPPMANWDGTARGNYDTIVGVQTKALTELEGIMSSTAQSCYAGAQLNRAVFFVVAKAIRKGVGAINGATGSGFLTYYRRTSTAISVMQDLEREIAEAEDGGVADGSSNSLRREHRRTIEMPHLLKVGMWPTGSDGAAYNPARTGEGVRSDGSNADLRVDGNTGPEGEGVKL